MFKSAWKRSFCAFQIAVTSVRLMRYSKVSEKNCRKRDRMVCFFQQFELKYSKVAFAMLVNDELLEEIANNEGT